MALLWGCLDLPGYICQCLGYIFSVTAGRRLGACQALDLMCQGLTRVIFLIAETKHLAEAAEGRVYVGSLLEATVHYGREIMVAGA